MKSLFLALLVSTSIISCNDNEIPDEGVGEYIEYDYHYEKVNDKYAVNFSPSLPDDEAILYGAIEELIIVIYGDKDISNSEPSFVERSGVDIIKLSTKKGNYFILLIQNYGRFHSLALWKENT